MSCPKILYLHGLESGPAGAKVRYLQNKYGRENVIAPNLRTGTWEFGMNSAITQGLLNLPYLLVWNYFPSVCAGMLNGAVAEAEQAIADFKPDIMVASSMGGAVALELLNRGKVKTPTLLLAPALKHVKCGAANTRTLDTDVMKGFMEEWYVQLEKEVITIKTDDDATTARSLAFPITIIHGDKDETINIEDSEELSARIGAKLVRVEGGDHRLHDVLLCENSDKNMFDILVNELIEHWRTTASSASTAAPEAADATAASA